MDSLHHEQNNFKPFIPAEKRVSEFTATSVILGIILAVLFGGANAYLGLRVGMTVSASIPAAVISMGVIRIILRKDSVLENNMVQTIGSAGESLAAGAIFTMPVLFMWAAEGKSTMPGLGEIALICICGGALGVFFMIPLRSALIVQEHGVLPYPEGTACAEVLLAGEGAEINLCGMAIADKNQHVDNHTSIDHAVPNCTSNELFKYVLDDQSVGAFAGLVLVRPDAQHTNSQQTNRNLCATRDARMYTQPQLEIYADDVKCSHGATVGQLDEGALFYMRSRGIAEKEARLLLMFAFVNEVIDTIRLEALKDRLHLLVEKRFRGELNRCQGCAICK